MEKETLEEAAERLTENVYQHNTWEEGRLKRQGYYKGVIEGAKWQSERMYSEEELREAFHVGRLYQGREGDVNFEKWFEQIARGKK
jgi:hypothetical protein